MREVGILWGGHVGDDCPGIINNNNYYYLYIFLNSPIPVENRLWQCNCKSWVAAQQEACTYRLVLRHPAACPIAGVWQIDDSGTCWGWPSGFYASSITCPHWLWQYRWTECSPVGGLLLRLGLDRSGQELGMARTDDADSDYCQTWCLWWPPKEPWRVFAEDLQYCTDLELWTVMSLELDDYSCTKMLCIVWWSMLHH